MNEDIIMCFGETLSFETRRSSVHGLVSIRVDPFQRLGSTYDAMQLSSMRHQHNRQRGIRSSKDPSDQKLKPGNSHNT